jgi:glycosyltransferase involved in cell wall biosynthesis
MSRILLSAYACEPGKGSEPAVGWMWATELAALGHEVWVITRTANRCAIEHVLRRHDPSRPHFVYCDLPRWARTWKHLPGAIYLYYFLWQWLAFLQAARLNRAEQFDCVHHVTFVSLRAPSFMGWLGIPFYFGPVSGGERVPPALRHMMTARARVFEFARDCANLLAQCDPLMRSAFQRADRIYLTSRDSLNLVPSQYHHKCEVRLAIGLTQEQLGISGRKPSSNGPILRCVYVGRLLEWKGLQIALLSMQRLKLRGVPARLTLIGDGPAKASLQSLAQQLGVASELTWLPWLPHDDVQGKLRHHDVFLFPSLRDSGGMAVLEALANGLPVICTDLGGPATIVDNHCGRVILTAGKDAEVIADDVAAHLRELACNRGLGESLSLGARRRAWEFDFRRLVASVYGANPTYPANSTGAAELAEIVSA